MKRTKIENIILVAIVVIYLMNGYLMANVFNIPFTEGVMTLFIPFAVLTAIVADKFEEIVDKFTPNNNKAKEGVEKKRLKKGYGRSYGY